ncbi:MAG TPA: HAMP domain-containing sensor histidine kinase [Longimicrobium sp.]|nr:HAMP domain-containing sensor histidine kinase [Longimicrobium sp.]
MERRRPPPRPLEGPVWTGRLAMFFVFVALAVLAVVPALLQRRLAPLREQAEAADEARTLVTRVQFALAAQTSALRDALLTPDSADPRLYLEAAALERSAYPPLDSLTARLSDSARAAFVRLRSLSAAWHASVDEEAVLRGGAPGGRATLSRGRPLYEQALLQARTLDAAVAQAAARRRTDIRRVEQREDALAAAMSLAALLAAAVLGWIGRRMRMLAREAVSREDEAESALAEARRLAQSRERLMRGVTHDLKNPLGAADGYTQLLQDGVEGELAPGQQEMLASIRRCHAAALDLISDLLDFSRAEAGTLALECAPADGAAIAREAVAEYAGTARAAGHALEALLPGAPLPCTTDRARVMRIVGNLLSNAVKYTPAPGRIVLEARPVEAGEGAGGGGRWIELSVRDTGPGIPAAERERIFDEFHRLHDGETQGHGLGLATSRRIARLLGGDITVAEAQGGGSVFRLRLPVATREATVAIPGSGRG